MAIYRSRGTIMAIYTNEHLTDLLNDQYARVRELEAMIKELEHELEETRHLLSVATRES